MPVTRHLVAVVTIELGLNRAVDGREPVPVLRTHAAHDLGVDALNLARHRTHLAGPNWAMVDLDDGSDLRAGAGEEDLVGGVELRAINDTLAGDAVQLAAGDLDDAVARGAHPDVTSRRG